ncbi:hypothetical protein B7P43_G04741 [Cryptotermes secundus]|uniref:DUF4817 domain-containing protein n=1 Tax=Cryptotermes secundus TaxID=105785 RepID=A0A2J7RQF1_9NEOP|nr:hypothetical protein B7P43_G04741 [Cryptotermes secundus]
MAFSKREQSFCVLEYARTSSVVTAQRPYEPVLNSLEKWYEKFRDEGCLCTAPRSGRAGPSEETVFRVRQAHGRSLRKFTTRTRLALGISQSTVWRVICKRLHMLCRNHAIVVFTYLQRWQLIVFEAVLSEVQTFILIHCLEWESRKFNKSIKRVKER